MNDNEKQIEEMAREIMKTQDCKGYEDNRGCYFSNGKGCDKCKIERHENAQIMADHLYNAGYLKLPEDSVVLKDTEYVKLCRMAYDTQSHINQARKETAEKFYDKVMSYIGTNQKFWIVDNEHITIIEVDKLFDFVMETVKQFGVEIKE